jgi:hypothetical protein
MACSLFGSLAMAAGCIHVASAEAQAVPQAPAGNAVPVTPTILIAPRPICTLAQLSRPRHRQSSPRKDATYLNVTPDNNDGKAVFKLNVRDVPVEGFWSITVYNAKGYFEPNQYKRLFREQRYGQEKHGRLSRCSIRRL